LTVDVPLFGRAAAREGFTACHVIPMRLRRNTIGAINRRHGERGVRRAARPCPLPQRQPADTARAVIDGTLQISAPV